MVRTSLSVAMVTSIGDYHREQRVQKKPSVTRVSPAVSCLPKLAGHIFGAPWWLTRLPGVLRAARDVFVCRVDCSATKTVVKCHLP